MLLELGGKAPLVVLDDADLDQAVDAAAFGAFLNQGQICMSTERLIVDEAVADAFVEKLAAKATRLPAGDPRGHVVLGSLIGRSTTRSERAPRRTQVAVVGTGSAGLLPGRRARTASMACSARPSLCGGGAVLQ